ncbi:MAG: Gfo/Idh/MocA family protein [Promethearchaeota archaeon]
MTSGGTEVESSSQEDEKVGWGVVGAGHSAKNVARAIDAYEDAVLVGVYNHNLAGAENLADSYGAEIATDDLSELVTLEGVDAVVICTPHHLHLLQALEAIEAGCHVLCEKPMGLNPGEALQMIEAAKIEDVYLGAYFQRRFHPAVQDVKALVGSGVLGTVSQASVQIQLWRDPPYYGESSWRGSLETEGGGALINQSIHWVDLLYYIFGKVDSVFAFGDTMVQDVEVEDSLVGVLRFASGLQATLSASTASFPGFPPRVAIHGSRGSVVMEGFKAWLHDEKGKPGEIFVDSTGYDDHRAIVEDFSDAILYSTDLAIPGEEGLRSLEIVDALYKSATNGRRVPVRHRRFK